jgi:hypothetical protein
MGVFGQSDRGRRFQLLLDQGDSSTIVPQLKDHRWPARNIFGRYRPGLKSELLPISGFRRAKIRHLYAEVLGDIERRFAAHRNTFSRTPRNI